MKFLDCEGIPIVEGVVMVTKGHRRLGKTIRILENSVELSTKERCAREDENQFKANLQAEAGLPSNSPVQNLHDIANRRKETDKGMH